MGNGAYANYPRIAKVVNLTAQIPHISSRIKSEDDLNGRLGVFCMSMSTYGTCIYSHI